MRFRSSLLWLGHLFEFSAFFFFLTSLWNIIFLFIFLKSVYYSHFATFKFPLFIQLMSCLLGHRVSSLTSTTNYKNDPCLTSITYIVLQLHYAFVFSQGLPHYGLNCGPTQNAWALNLVLMKVILFGKKMRLLMIELKQTREDPYSLWHCLNKKVEVSAEKNAFTARRKCEVIQKTTNYKSRRMRPTVPGNRQGDSDFHGFQKEPTLTNTLLSNFQPPKL